MCHSWMLRDRIYQELRDRASEETQDQMGGQKTDERPSFLNEESSVDTELLTDGGDENERN
jgi:hypothetical protein